MKKEDSKKTIVVIFGGKSVEHDISIITGVQTLNAVDKNKYNVIPIYISKEGDWYTSNLFYDIKTFTENDFCKKAKKIAIGLNKNLYLVKNKKMKFLNKIDFALLATHGGQGENGCLQGLFESCSLPYSSPGVLGSAICMNKLITKRILQSLNVATAKYLALTKNEYKKRNLGLKEKLSLFKFPLIVKPANLGSSVGISFCKNFSQLKNALSFAFLFDEIVLIEEVVENLKEYNIAVVGNSNTCELSNIEEVIIKKDFLSFESKYLNKENSSKGMENTLREIPANLPIEVEQKIKTIAQKTYFNLYCKGIVRMDFLVNSKTREVLLNEVNTIPGSLSNYLWLTKKYNFKILINKAIKYCLEDWENNKSKVTNFSSTVLKQFGEGSKINFKK